MRNRPKLAAVMVAAALAGGSSGALAATPNSQQYGDPGASEPTSVPEQPTPEVTVAGGSGAAPVSAVEGETLPFTGQNVALAVGLGGAFVLAGLGLRRAGRQRQ